MLTLEKILKKCQSNYELFDAAVSLVLVARGARPACLIQIHLWGKKAAKFHTLFDTINRVTEADLVLFDMPYEILVCRRDSWVAGAIQESPETLKYHNYIGHYLGFQCAGEMFWDTTKPRITVSIIETVTNMEIYTEVCEFSKHSVENLLQSTSTINCAFQKVLNPLGYDTKVEITVDDGTHERYKQLREGNRKYIEDWLDEYMNDFENYYISDPKTFKTSKTYKHLAQLNHLDLISQVYLEYVVENRGLELYKSADYDIKKILQIAKEVKKIDDAFWKQHES
jgi:hypothetical protein